MLISSDASLSQLEMCPTHESGVEDSGNDSITKFALTLLIRALFGADRYYYGLSASTPSVDFDDGRDRGRRVRRLEPVLL